MKPFNIVLVAPEIPQNTGSIGRLCVSTNARLHLLKPLGFVLDDKHLKRAGMDYWPHLDLTIYENWEEFLEKNNHPQCVFFSTHGVTDLWTADYDADCFLVFGSEGHGLPPEFYVKYKDNFILIPMEGEFVRSLNLANSVSIALYEGLRRQKFNGEKK